MILPDKHGGFIDFLGIDRDNHLHIVETKVGPDSMLVFQVLDYLIWVTAHACEIRAHRGWPAAPNDTPVHVDLVLAQKGDTPAMGPYTVRQLEALAPDVRWWVWTVTDTLAPAPVLTALTRDQVHMGEPTLIGEVVRPA